MEPIKFAVTSAKSRTQLASDPSAKDQSVNDVRVIEDWELALVGGGEDTPTWG